MKRLKQRLRCRLQATQHRLAQWRIGRRLRAGFTGLLLITGVLVALCLVSMSRIEQQMSDIVVLNNHKTELLHQLRSLMRSQSVTVRDLMLESIDEQKQQYADDLLRQREEYRRYGDELTPLLTQPQERDHYQQATTAVTGIDQALDKAVKLALDHQQAAAVVFVNRRAAPLQRQALDAIDAMITLQQQFNEQTLADVAQQTALARWLTVLLAVLLIGAGLLVALLITRSITDPLAVAATLAANIARGDLHTTLPPITGRDEVSDLLRSMSAMQQTLVRFVAAQSDMALAHAEGRISQRMDAAPFGGVYRDMATSINELAASHIAVQHKIVDVMGQYAQGDLSRELDALPGEQCVISDTMAEVRRKLQAVNGELLQLVQQAAAGDLSARGDAERFQHDFRQMIDGLNRLMTIAEDGLDDVGELLAEIARGNLTQTIDRAASGTFAQLNDDANATVRQLRQIVLGIRDATESIHLAAQEIASGNTDLSSRYERQTAALESASRNMGTLIDTVRGNAQQAVNARELVNGAAQLAIRGGDIVSEAIGSMQVATEAMTRIGDIVSLIDGIAFQTNILALNAAVEAARAGEAGRGFAVVASEVRALAQRCTVSAREIKDLIGHSHGAVEAGARQIGVAGDTMSDIVASVRRITDIISSISDASRRQTDDIQQVNDAISIMERDMQQNAALVEQTASATLSMADQAAGLSDLVAVFRIESAPLTLTARAA